MKGDYAYVHSTKFFKCCAPVDEASTSKPKTIIKSKDRMYIVDSGASLCMVGKSSLSARDEDQTKLVEYLKIRQCLLDYCAMS